MSQKVKSLKVIRKPIPLSDTGAGHASADQEEVVVSETEYHPEWEKVILERQYAADGTLEQETAYEYDKNGFLIRETLREGDGTVMEEKSFEPDEKQRIAREFLHYADGSKDTITYRYDAQGRLVEKRSEDEDGDLEQLEIFEYRNGHMVRKAVFDEEPAGEDESEPAEEIRYTVDDAGRMLEEEICNHTDGYYRHKVHVYNDNGHRIAVKVYDEEEELVERVLMEPDEEGRPVRLVEENRKKKNTLNLRYNNKGDIVYQEEYDLKGNLLNTVSREYDEKGRLLSSEVEIRMPLQGPPRRYVVEHRYIFA